MSMYKNKYTNYEPPLGLVITLVILCNTTCYKSGRQGVVGFPRINIYHHSLSSSLLPFLHLIRPLIPLAPLTYPMIVMFRERNPYQNLFNIATVKGGRTPR